MKIKHIIFFISSSIFSVLFNQVQAQVGVNTEYPRSIFHIDGAGDNPHNFTSLLSDLQQSNDVIITNDGKLGVGTIAPTTKLDIIDNKSITGQEPLRLTPAPNEASILYLDTDGQTTKWRKDPNLGVLGQFEVTSTSFDNRKATYAYLKKKGGTMTVDGDAKGNYKIRVPANGRYFVTLNICGTNTTTAERTLQSLYVYLAKNDTQVQSMEVNAYYTGIGGNLSDVVEYYQALPKSKVAKKNSFTVSLYAGYCLTSDYLVIRFAPVISYDGTASFKPDALNPIIITIHNI